MVQGQTQLPVLGKAPCYLDKSIKLWSQKKLHREFVFHGLISGHFYMLLCLLLTPFSSILCLVKNCPSELRSEFTSVRKLSLTTLHP